MEEEEVDKQMEQFVIDTNNKHILKPIIDFNTTSLSDGIEFDNIIISKPKTKDDNNKKKVNIVTLKKNKNISLF
jgi:hypothetical protein